LLDLKFVRNVTGELVGTASACRRGAEKLTPYLHMVESRFWDDYNDLVNFTNIPQLPSKEHVLQILGVLRTKNALNAEDLDVAIEDI
jgi:hypothetical protein